MQTEPGNGVEEPQPVRTGALAVSGGKYRALETTLQTALPAPDGRHGTATGTYSPRLASRRWLTSYWRGTLLSFKNFVSRQLGGKLTVALSQESRGN